MWFRDVGSDCESERGTAAGSTIHMPFSQSVRFMESVSCEYHTSAVLYMCGSAVTAQSQYNTIHFEGSHCLTCFSRLINADLLLGSTGCFPNFSAPRTPKVHPWFTGSAGQGNLPTAAKWFDLVGSSLQ
jgi:hypothetical protein